MPQDFSLMFVNPQCCQIKTFCGEDGYINVLLFRQGTVFFPMPDGNGVLYNLTGTADPPKPVDKIATKEIPCKTSYTHMLPVDNWLKKPQR